MHFARQTRSLARSPLLSVSQSGLKTATARMHFLLLLLVAQNTSLALGGKLKLRARADVSCINWVVKKERGKGKC